MKKYLPHFGWIGLGIALIAIWWQSHHFSEKLTELNEQLALQHDSLRYYELKSRAEARLREEKYSEALAYFQQADEKFSGSALTAAATQWIAARESVLAAQKAELENARKNQVERLQRKLQTSLQALLLQKEDLRQREAQIQAMKAELEHFSEQIANLQKELLEQACSIGKLEFKTARGTDAYYVGEIKNGKANGFGAASFSTGNFYVGTWKNNRRHGTGRYLWKDGSIYDGEFQDDYRTGFGTYIFPTGEKYVGQWQNDKREGSGTLLDKEGNVLLDGLWKNDAFVHGSAVAR